MSSSSEEKELSTFELLPFELQARILLNLDIRSIAKLREVSASFKGIISNLSRERAIKFQASLFRGHRDLSINEHDIDPLKLVYALKLIETGDIITANKGVQLLTQDIKHPLVHSVIPEYYSLESHYRQPGPVHICMLQLLNTSLEQVQDPNVQLNNSMLLATICRDGRCAHGNRSQVVILPNEERAREIMQELIASHPKRECLNVTEVNCHQIAGVGLLSLLEHTNGADLTQLNVQTLQQLRSCQNANVVIECFKESFSDTWSETINSCGEPILVCASYLLHHDQEFQLTEDSLNTIRGSLMQNIDIRESVSMRVTFELMSQWGILHNIGISFNDIEQGISFQRLFNQGDHPSRPESLKSLLDFVHKHFDMVSDVNQFLEEISPIRASLLTSDHTEEILSNIKDPQALIELSGEEGISEKILSGEILEELGNGPEMKF